MANFKKKLLKMLEDEAIKAIHGRIAQHTEPAKKPVEDDAIAALVSLGYKKIDAHRALQGVSFKLSTEDRVKSALKNL